MSEFFLLRKNELPSDIEIHTDPFSRLPAALSKQRAFKLNKIQQAPYPDNDGGAQACRFCNPELLDGQPEYTLHCDSQVMSFPNAAPFLPGDQRVFCLWHPDADKRYRGAHRFKFSDFGRTEFYLLSKAASSRAQEYVIDSPLKQEPSPYRCVAGFNIGKLAGQSIPHLHLQCGWEVVVEPMMFGEELRSLFYHELRLKRLVLHEDDEMLLIVPWTPKGQYHVEIHFKDLYEITELSDGNLRVLSYISDTIMSKYAAFGIENVNILITSSPRDRRWTPLTVQFVPRVNMPAMYEMTGVNVVDTPPENILSFFQDGIRWSDVFSAAKTFEADKLYTERFGSKAETGENET